MKHYQIPKLFRTILRVVDGQGGLTKILVFHRWEGYTLQQVIRWQWYFRYRGALYQIQYPKAKITINTMKYDAEGPKLQQALRNRWIAKKRKITEWTNRIARAEATYNELFPIEEHKVYQKAVAKLKRLKEEFVELNEIYIKSQKQ